VPGPERPFNRQERIVPTLYRDHNAVCCQKVELALFEKTIAFDERTISLFRSEQYGAPYLKINPRGVVPALVHGDNTIIESTVICEYLDEAFGGARLMPRDAAQRAQVRMWTKLVDEEIHEAASVLSFCAMFRNRMLSMPEGEREKRYRNVGNPVRDDMYRSSVELGVEAPVAYRAIAAYELMARALETRLATSGTWIATSGYSLAEIALTPYCARIEYLGLIDLWLADRALVSLWWQQVKNRDSFDFVFKRVLSPDDIDEMRTSGDKIRTRVAQRRGEYLDANAFRQA
jgi:glutathione S-transferase